MKRKGRKVRPAQPEERRQYAPGQLVQRLDRGVRENIERIAGMGYEQNGRGVLIVQISDDVQTGIVNAEYLPIMQIAEMNRTIPFADAQPINEAVKTYDPEREFVALVMDITPSLPGPQIWFDVFPRTGVAMAPELQPQSTHKPRGRKVPPPTPKQTSAMVTAYALIEDMARAGFTEKGRGFVFNAIYPDGTEPYIDYLTLDREPGRGFADTAPDLVEMVRTYDPQTSFIIFDATIDFTKNQLRDVQIDVVTYLTGKAVSSA